jgi:hypothetical protein
MTIHPDKVLEYIDWFIQNEIIKCGGAENWSKRKECRCGPATLTTIISAFLPTTRFVNDHHENLFLGCVLFLDPYYPEGVLVFWGEQNALPIEIPNIPYVQL